MRIFVNEFCGHPFPLELSRELSRRGHDVLHVFFADNQSTPKGPTKRLPGDPDGLAIEEVHINGRFSKHSILRRRRYDIEYGNASAEKLAKFRPDVVLSANMPLDGQKILLDAAKAENAKFVFWLQDLYCFAVRFVLARKAPGLSWLGHNYYRHLEMRLLQESDAVVTISREFQEELRNWGINGNKVRVIPNWAPLGDVLPAPKQNPWAIEQGVADRFCFLYSGTLGMKHRPELLLEFAKYLETRSDAKLIVVAGGAGAEWLASRASEVSSRVLSLLPFQPYERLSQILGAADVLIGLLDSEAGAFAVPSKVLCYLCAGRPILIAAPASNQAVRVLKSANAGLAVSPDDVSQLIAAAQQLMNNAAVRLEYGRNARAFAEQTFCIHTIADRFLEVITP